MPVICLGGFFCRLCVRKNTDGGADGRVGEGRQDRHAGILPVWKGEVMNGECRRGQAMWCLIWSPPQMGQSMLYHSLSLWERSVCHSELAPAGLNSRWVVPCGQEDCPPVIPFVILILFFHTYPALQRILHFQHCHWAQRDLKPTSHLMTIMGYCYFSFRNALVSPIYLSWVQWYCQKAMAKP